jgi:hypothetical protein
MLRHAIGESAKCAGLDATAVAELMGHGGPGPIHAMPLPNVGHYRADGRIRRVMIAATAQTPADRWSAIRRRLAGEVLSGHQGDPVVRMRPEARALERTTIVRPGTCRPSLSFFQIFQREPFGKQRSDTLQERLRTFICFMCVCFIERPCRIVIGDHAPIGDLADDAAPFHFDQAGPDDVFPEQSPDGSVALCIDVMELQRSLGSVKHGVVRP